MFQHRVFLKQTLRFPKTGIFSFLKTEWFGKAWKVFRLVILWFQIAKLLTALLLPSFFDTTSFQSMSKWKVTKLCELPSNWVKQKSLVAFYLWPEQWLHCWCWTLVVATTDHSLSSGTELPAEDLNPSCEQMAAKTPRGRSEWECHNRKTRTLLCPHNS